MTSLDTVFVRLIDAELTPAVGAVDVILGTAFVGDLFGVLLADGHQTIALPSEGHVGLFSLATLDLAASAWSDLLYVLGFRLIARHSHSPQAVTSRRQRSVSGRGLSWSSFSSSTSIFSMHFSRFQPHSMSG